ncbi:MAG: hypothetical protein ACRC8S_00395 [Fimbriiglobus sp.]
MSTNVSNLRELLSLADFQTRAGPDEYRLLPGRVGLNFQALFVSCRQPGGMAE